MEVLILPWLFLLVKRLVTKAISLKSHTHYVNNREVTEGGRGFFEVTSSSPNPQQQQQQDETARDHYITVSRNL